MATEQSPAFQAYPRDFVGDLDVAALDLEQVGFYWMLLCYAWMKDGLPDDFSKISRALRISTAKFQKLWEVVGEKFYRDDEGKWRNARQEEEREKQRKYREERSLAGKRGNAERWGEARSAIAEPSLGESLSDEKRIAKHRSSSSSALSSSSSSSESDSLSVVPIATGPHRSHAFCSIACVPAFLHVEFRTGLNRANEDEADAELRTGYLAHIKAWPEGKATGNNLDFWRSWYRATYPAPTAKTTKAQQNQRDIDAWLKRDAKETA
jgi:uncharacterized protein YdaU (DUF1376 family)